jgi:C1A family cysteine protease
MNNLEERVDNLEKQNEMLSNCIIDLESRIDSLEVENNNLKNSINSNNENNIIDAKLNEAIIDEINDYPIIDINMKTPINMKYNLIREITPHPVPEKLILKFNKNITLPSKIDLRFKCPAVYNQGIIGSCTANALMCLYQYDDPRFYGSRLFLYYNSRLLLGSINEDSGAYLYDGITAMKKYGICREILWPYNTSKFTNKPSPLCYTDGLSHQVLEAFQVKPNTYDMKACLNSGEPFVFGFAIFDNFEDLNTTKTGYVSIPTNKNQFLGGHAVVCVGYDDNLTYKGIKGYWIVRNSWGSKWGDRGYFYLPYKYLDIPNVFSDLWKITKVEK